MGLSEDGAISFESYKTREEGIARARERWVEQNYQAVDAFHVFNEKIVIDYHALRLNFENKKEK